MFCIVIITINLENVSSYLQYKTIFICAKWTIWTVWPVQYCFKFMCTCWLCSERVPLSVITLNEKGGEWIFSVVFLFSFFYFFYPCCLDKNIYFIIMVTFLMYNTHTTAYMMDLKNRHYLYEGFEKNRHYLEKHNFFFRIHPV